MLFRDITFKLHEKVTWWDSLPDQMREADDGEGPFEIVKIEDVPKNEWANAGAKQQVTIVIHSKKKKFSALFFQHLN